LDVNFTVIDRKSEDGPDQNFKEALDDFKLFALHLPVLESLSFQVAREFLTQLKFPEDLFCWEALPPTKLRHIALRGCYGGGILAARNLTSFELAGYVGADDPVELHQYTFLQFISANPPLISLRLSHCKFLYHKRSSRMTPVKLPELKSLRLVDIDGLSGFPGLIDIPAFKALSSLRISAREPTPTYVCYYDTSNSGFLARAESDDGFYGTRNANQVAPGWLDITHGADPSPTFVRLEGRERDLTKENEMKVSPLPLFVNTKVLEIGASFASLWYRDFWDDLENVGPQLTTLRLEVVEGAKSAVAKSVK
jgi:hypothetical protein